MIPQILVRTETKWMLPEQPSIRSAANGQNWRIPKRVRRRSLETRGRQKGRENIPPSRFLGSINPWLKS